MTIVLIVDRKCSSIFGSKSVMGYVWRLSASTLVVKVAKLLS